MVILSANKTNNNKERKAITGGGAMVRRSPPIDHHRRKQEQLEIEELIFHAGRVGDASMHKTIAPTMDNCFSRSGLIGRRRQCRHGHQQHPDGRTEQLNCQIRRCDNSSTCPHTAVFQVKLAR